MACHRDWSAVSIPRGHNDLDEDMEGVPLDTWLAPS